MMTQINLTEEEASFLQSVLWTYELNMKNSAKSKLYTEEGKKDFENQRQMAMDLRCKIESATEA